MVLSIQFKISSVGIALSVAIVTGNLMSNVTALAADPVAQVQAKPPSVPSRLLSELKSGDAATRRAAANELGSLRAKPALRALISALADKDASVREAAAFALGQMTEPRAADALIKAMSDKDTEVRASAAFALGMLEDRKAVRVLSGALDDSESAARSGAVTGLGLMQDPQALDEIVQTLNDSSFDVRYDAVWALGYFGEPDAASHLRAALVSIDLIRIDDGSREAFRQLVQSVLENLRPGEEGASSTRPRRVTTPAEVLSRTTRPIAILQGIRPAPTDRASRAGVKGSVGLRVLVGADGKAVRAYVTRRLGLGLDQRAVQAVLQYRFSPALLDGLPQTEWLNLEVKF